MNMPWKRRLLLHYKTEREIQSWEHLGSHFLAQRIAYCKDLIVEIVAGHRAGALRVSGAEHVWLWFTYSANIYALYCGWSGKHELIVDEKVSQVIGSTGEKYTQEQMVEDLKLWGRSFQMASKYGYTCPWGKLIIHTHTDTHRHTHTHKRTYNSTVAVSLKRKYRSIAKNASKWYLLSMINPISKTLRDDSFLGFFPDFITWEYNWVLRGASWHTI